LRNTKKPCHSFPNNSLQVNDGATESSAQYQGQVEKARTAQLSDQAISDDEWTHTESENEEPSNAGSKTFLNFSECEDEGVESFPGELFAGSDTPVDLNGLHGVATHADADTVDREAADILQMLHGSHSPINLVGSEGAIIDADADTVDREAVDVLQMLQPGKWLAHSAVFRILRNFGIFRIIDVGNIPPAAERHLWTFPTLSRSRLSEEVLFCPLVLSDRDHWVLLYFARSTHQVIHLDSLLSTNLKPDNLEYVAKMIVKSLGHVWDDEHWTLVRDKTVRSRQNIMFFTHTDIF
jgi:hypothetical protein